MAENPKQVTDFLKDLAVRSKKMGIQEYNELQNYAKEQSSIDELQAWDMAYYAEKLKQKKFSIIPIFIKYSS